MILRFGQNSVINSDSDPHLVLSCIIVATSERQEFKIFLALL